MFAKALVPMFAAVAGALAALALAPPAAWANDSALAYGGSPRPLAGHPTVSMKSEYVRIEVGEMLSTVDCRFVFENHGPACRVRMGFPDQGRGAADPDEEGPRNPPEGAFESFRSWVGGRPVPTTVIRAAHPGNFWHVKTVEFPAHGALTVRDRYTVDVGSSVGFEVPFSVHWTSYLLHTGSSWHGPIGRSEVVVVFRRQGVRAPLLARRLRDEGGRPNFLRDRTRDRRVVYYAGPGRPTVAGKTLRFVRTQWRPTPADDIDLIFEVTPLRTTR